MPGFRVGKPRVGLGLDSNQVVPGYTDYKIPWDAARYQDPTLWSAGAPTEYPINKTGLWLVNFAAFVIPPINGVVVYLELFVNGGYWRYQSDFTNGNFDQVWMTVFGELQEGDILEAAVYVSNADPSTLVAYDATTGLHVTRIGPERWT